MRYTQCVELAKRSGEVSVQVVRERHLFSCLRSGWEACQRGAERASERAGRGEIYVQPLAEEAARPERERKKDAVATSRKAERRGRAARKREKKNYIVGDTERKEGR